MTPGALLDVRGLSLTWGRGQRALPIVQDASFAIPPRGTLALVGESGSGKTMTALSLLRLFPPRAPARISGQALLEGRDLVALSPRELRQVRGRRVAMIFQEPQTSLNPVQRVGDQIGEGLVVHEGLSRRAARERAAGLLAEVGIAEPGLRARSYPHELSGGMQQRVMIAMALALGPRLLLADEPTTALDVTVQAQVLELIRDRQAARGMAVLLITHDLGVVARLADAVLVMYAGRIVEAADIKSIFESPAHPYTLGLLRAVPRPGLPRGKLAVIPGQVQGPAARPAGCAFHPRCPVATPRCAREIPPETDLGAGRRVRCFEWEQVRARGAEIWQTA